MYAYNNYVSVKHLSFQQIVAMNSQNFNTLYNLIVIQEVYLQFIFEIFRLSSTTWEA